LRINGNKKALKMYLLASLRRLLNTYFYFSPYSILRGSDCKYRESVDRLKKSNILITCQKNTFGELSSKILFKLSGTLLFSRNSEKTVFLS